jgi:hypothetical protein
MVTPALRPRKELPMPTGDDRWPTLDYVAGKDTLEALHMQTQVVGKVKLALTLPAPQWQNVPLWVNARGLTTGLLRAADTGVEVAFDLIDHRLMIATTDGRLEGFDLIPRRLCDFTAEVMAALARLDVLVTINPVTVEMPNPIRCDVHEGYDAYDPDVANRLFTILTRTATTLDDFRAGFWGKQSPVSFYWGTFDLAVTRFNLVPVPRNDRVDIIRRVAMDSEQTEVGFWPGNERHPRPAFFAYTFPKPPGIESSAIRPDAAAWSAEMGEFLLDYEDVRAADDPRAAILEFANSTYAVGADLSGWDRGVLDRSPPR